MKHDSGNIFDHKLYCNLLGWADNFLHNYKIDNLTSFDLIHEAYLKSVDVKEDFTSEKAKVFARQVLFTELHIAIEREWAQPWVDSWAVCTKCGEAYPVAAFGSEKGKYVDGYCKWCMAKIREKHRLKEFKQTCVKKTCRITVFNHFGEIILVAKSMIELAFKFRVCCKKTVEQILYKNYKHKTIHLYSDDVKFLERRYNNIPVNYYIKKEDL